MIRRQDEHSWKRTVVSSVVVALLVVAYSPAAAYMFTEDADPADAIGPPVIAQTGLSWAVPVDAIELKLEALGMVASDTAVDQRLFEQVEPGVQAGLRINHGFLNGE